MSRPENLRCATACWKRGRGGRNAATLSRKPRRRYLARPPSSRVDGCWPFETPRRAGRCGTTPSFTNSAPASMHLKITVEYDGTNYRGWQIQNGDPTVQGVPED